MPEETAHGSPTKNGAEHVSFSELARAHYDWDKQGDPDSRRRFEATLSAFELNAGEIVDAYWCRKDASAVALTKRELRGESRLGILIGHEPDSEYRLYRVSDWVTGDTREIPDLLHECDILAIKAGSGLEGVPRAVVMQWLLSVETHVLGFIERHGKDGPSRAELTRFAARERQELNRIEDYYHRAGEKRARLRYVEGMLGFGVLLLLILAVLTALVLAVFDVFDVHDPKIREFYASAVAGGLGAVISVLMRMSGRGEFAIDHELGRFGVLLVGAYRPVIGSVSGIIVYFLVQTTFFPVTDSTRTLPFYVVVAFLAGFSERWTRMVLSGAMRTIGEGEADPHAAPPAPPPPAAAAKGKGAAPAAEEAAESAPTLVSG